MAIAYQPWMFQRDDYIRSLYERDHTYAQIADKVEKRYKQRLGHGRIYQILAKTGAKRSYERAA